MSNILYTFFYFAITFVMVASCEPNEKQTLGDNDCGISLKETRKVFSDQKADSSLSLAYIDSLVQEYDPNKNPEQYIYLTNLSTFLNSRLTLEDKEIYFLDQIRSEDFEKHSPYLKYTIRHNLYMIFIEQKNYSLGAEEILIAISYLEDLPQEQGYKLEMANCYYRIAYIGMYFLDDIEQSIIAYQKALKIYETNKQYKDEQSILYNLGLHFYDIGDFSEAKKYIEKAISIFENKIPFDPSLTWRAIYPLYLKTLVRLDKYDQIKPIYEQAKLIFDQKKISELDYDNFCYLSLDPLIHSGMDDEFKLQIHRLQKKYVENCVNKYALTNIYGGVALYQKKQGDKRERETLIKQLEIVVSCEGLQNFYIKAYVIALDRLIEIEKENKDIEALNIWHEKKIGLAEIKKEKQQIYLKQADFWYEKDLRHKEREITYHKERLDTLRIQMSILAICSSLLLLLSFLIWRLLREVKIKNRELKNSYQAQRAQKQHLEKQNGRLENANQLVKDKNIDLIGELKNQLLLASNNNKVLNNLENEINKSVKNLNSRNALKEIIKECQNESIWEEIDQKFLLLNEPFFKALSKHFPILTKNDLKLCALVKMNLSAKEIARIQYQSQGSIKVAKYRLRKKMKLNGLNITLVGFLNSLTYSDL